MVGGSVYSNVGGDFVELKKSSSGTCERLVAFLDIMGFRDMVVRQNRPTDNRCLFA